MRETNRYRKFIHRFGPATCYSLLMLRPFYLLGGILSLVLGGIGVILPLLPTVPFVILAAFCFARSSPKLEAWLLEHKQFGPHIIHWRDQRAITKKGKRAALLAFAASITVALIFLKLPWNLFPIAAALIGGTWIWTRAEPADSVAPPVLGESEDTDIDAA